MKRASRILILVISALCCTFLNSCVKDIDIIKNKLTGVVQKGPFINGTSITMYELNSKLIQTGKSFYTQISSNDGSFKFDDFALNSGYAEFVATGYYYDEIKGALSSDPLTLYALSDVSDISTLNINILTHLEKSRIEYLIKNKSLTEAKLLAQAEILAIFGYDVNDIDRSESLNISVNKEGNAILLAISVILQGNRSVADLTEILANITNDLREDGLLNDETIKADLRNTAIGLNLASIRMKLEARYSELGMSTTIPPFEKYITTFLTFTGNKPTAFAKQASNLTANSATLR